MDIFDDRGVKPMLIRDSKEAFNSEEYIFELKLDGIRCIAYLDPFLNFTELINKRNKKLLMHVPELKDIHNQVKSKCILDGELVVSKNGIPDFEEIKRRAILSDPFKIKISSSKFPATFICYDILYINGEEISDLPLIERKKFLSETIMENERLAISRYIDTNGKALYELAIQQNLEGVVAKHITSKYWYGKKSVDWYKIKNLKQEDFIICGYIFRKKDMMSLVLGQYENEKLIYKGHVALGVNLNLLNRFNYKVISNSPFGYVPQGNDDAVWLEPKLFCKVQYMPNDKGILRHPVLKEIREM